MLMFALKTEQKPALTEFTDRFSKAIDRAWELSCVDAQDQIRNRIRKVLESKLLDWEIPNRLRLTYPYLVNRKSLIDNYIKCIDVETRSGNKNEIAVGINEDRLLSLGLPKYLSDLLEFGNEDIPSFSHLTKGIDDWLISDSKKLFEKLDMEISKLMR